MHRLVASLLLTGLGALALAGGAGAQNLLANPGFDHSLAGWTVIPGGPTSTWQTPDADGSAGSGSAKLTLKTSQPSGDVPALSQCVPITGGSMYAASAKVRTATTLDASNQVLPLLVEMYTSADCSGSRLFGAGPPLQAPHPDWTGIGITTPAPVGAQSARVVLEAQSGGALETFELDDAFLGLAAPSRCVSDATNLCLDARTGDQRWRVQATFSSPPRSVQGTAHAVSTAPLGITRGGLLWFFDATNPELLVKVIDGCAVTQHYWVYIAAGTDVGVELTISDTGGPGTRYLFRSPDGTAFPSIQDVFAIPCP